MNLFPPETDILRDWTVKEHREREVGFTDFPFYIHEIIVENTEGTRARLFIEFEFELLTHSAYIRHGTQKVDVTQNIPQAAFRIPHEDPPQRSGNPTHNPEHIEHVLRGLRTERLF